MTLTTYRPDRIAPDRNGQTTITDRKAATALLDRELERLALEAEQQATQAWTRPVDAGYRFTPTGWVDPDGTLTTLELLGRGGWELGSHVSAAQQTARWYTLAEREDAELLSLVRVVGVAGQVPARELDAARHQPTSLLVERWLAGLALALHAPESFRTFAPFALASAADRSVVADIAPATLRAVAEARETARRDWALDHADALLDGIVASLALRRRVERLGRARLRERAFGELVLRVRVQLAQVGRRALAGRLSDVGVGRALVRAELGLERLLAEGDGEVSRQAPVEPLCPGLLVGEEGPWPAREAWLVCEARDDLAYRHGGPEPHNRPASGRGHHRSGRPGGGSRGV